MNILIGDALAKGIETTQYDQVTPLLDLILNEHQGVLPPLALQIMDEVDNCDHVSGYYFRNRETNDLISVELYSGTASTLMGLCLDRQNKYKYSSATIGFGFTNKWIPILEEVSNSTLVFETPLLFYGEGNYVFKNLYSLDEQRYIKDDRDLILTAMKICQADKDAGLLDDYA